MTSALADAALADAARADAARAAAIAGVVVREVHRVEELAAVRRVFDAVWSAAPTNPAATVELLRAYAHTGQYVVVAHDAGSHEVIAASMGFLAEPIGRALHSNVTGVLPAGRGRSLGFALKLHQRAWALERGLDLVTWTFDPLIRRNAWFNLAKLAARPTEYLPDFYGEMADGVNAGDASDRLYVHWPLDDETVVRACAGHPHVLDVESLRTAPHAAPHAAPHTAPRTLLAATPTSAVIMQFPPTPDGDPGAVRADGPLLVQVPPDIEALRVADPALARDWRRALRATMGAAMAAGLRVAGVGRDGWYVLRELTEEETG